MKIINASVGFDEESNFKVKQIIGSRQGITKRLLEKYKHKSLENIESMRDSEDNKRLA